MPGPLKSPIDAVHRSLGAQMVPFAGYEMPVRYRSIQEEHAAVRAAAGLFDVSHMSNLWVRGPQAGEALAFTTMADARLLKPGMSKYTAVLREDGTILDDLYLFRLPDAFHIVPNAGRNRDIATWIADRTKAPVEDVTRDTCIFALQGPKAAGILQSLAEQPVAELRPFRCTMAKILGAPMLVSRTGYTGEDGFELFPSASRGGEVFRRILDAGRSHGLRPCGLGARDTLRLEKGFCLAGHEFEGGRTPLEAALDRFIHWEHEFLGRGALEAQKERGGYARLAGLQVEDRGIPRQGCEVRVRGSIQKVGVVTSGTLSPTLKRGIALAYLDPPHHEAGTDLDIVIRDATSPATVVELPFVK